VNTPSIVDLIDQTCELPAPPAMLHELDVVMANPESAAEDAAAVIVSQPSIAANILRIVNSPYYGLQVRVSSVDLAVSILGFHMTKKVTLQAAMFSTFAKKGVEHQHFDATAFWRHSVYVGVAARVLGQASSRCAGFHPEDLYVCGLVHDIGKLVLLDSSPDFEKTITISMDEQRPLHTVESEVLGFTHADVSAALAREWSLPDDVCNALRHHETPEADPSSAPLTSLLCIADRLAGDAVAQRVPAARLTELATTLLEAAGIVASQLGELTEQADADFETTCLPW
jgi:HD-like signal output (HDOD) protein